MRVLGAHVISHHALGEFSAAVLDDVAVDIADAHEILDPAALVDGSAFQTDDNQ